jgi:1-phosphofructokinase
MITAVCLNPCIDKMVSIEGFQYGGMNRIVTARSDVGGKGVNVAIVAAQLGMESECIGFLHQDNGKIVERKLLTSGTQGDFLWLDGQVRTNIKLLDQSTGKVTEINEPGLPVGQEQLDKMVDLVCQHAQDSDFMVFTGSLPPGCPKDYYKTLIDAVEGLNCRCVLDAEGALLAQGIQARPYLIKPNLYELETVVGRKLESLEEIRRAALDFIDQGIQVVAVSMGDKGTMITDGEQTLYAPCVSVPVKSTVGAGDSMITGLIAGLMAELPLQEVFRKGVACAAASVMLEGTLLPEKSTYRQLLTKVAIQNLDE